MIFRKNSIEVFCDESCNSWFKEPEIRNVDLSKTISFIKDKDSIYQKMILSFRKMTETQFKKNGDLSTKFLVFEESKLNAFIKSLLNLIKDIKDKNIEDKVKLFDIRLVLTEGTVVPKELDIFPKHYLSENIDNIVDNSIYFIKSDEDADRVKGMLDDLLGEKQLIIINGFKDIDVDWEKNDEVLLKQNIEIRNIKDVLITNY
jgi:hypothetical protein